ncbi:hypothetical protein [Aurantimonas sp. 22II-16-19i]|uniref:hypothetical protein n=1 Tax=Aurantimonas sp. 22II-16-19i TaxID=1317114 RepID=UPI0009F7BA5E|nr:hypothetical protein [Aurantimonas sp. 22II-16-19i]ORE98987.1 hypothetical protein ATO4_01435 [Aurantimonas sp. 22II-16-19i]
MSSLKYCVIAVVVLLAGCAKPIVDETGPLNIQRVTVTTAPTVKSETEIGPRLQAAVSQKIVGKDPAGKPSTVNIEIQRVAYKNAVMSVLVGSANTLGTEITIADLAGNPLKTQAFNQVQDGAINGIVGAAISLMQEKALVDQQLIDGYSVDLERKIYGPPGHVPAVKAQPAAKPATVPAPQGAPVAEPQAIPTS